jgi:prepilin-type N-terminal cleavage/methylation domain-containing protein
MLCAPHSQNRCLSARTAFTLIEMMVVILIVGILFALVAGAVALGLTKGKQTRNRVEISQLEEAVEQFKQRFGTYPPSRILLCEKPTDYTNSALAVANAQLAQDSQALLSKMFPRIDWTGATPPGYFDWNGNGAQDNPVILEGDQCLAFFLGGLPDLMHGAPYTCLGFSNNPKNPGSYPASPSESRIGPFFEFDSNRLVVLAPPPQNNPYSRSTTHLSYLDNYSSSDGHGNWLYGAPYLYFSSYKATNGYNRYYGTGTPPYTHGDCPSVVNPILPGQPTEVWPYAQKATTTGHAYIKPNSFQIIAAGKDGLFGPGTDPNYMPPPGTPAYLVWNITTGAQITVNGQTYTYQDSGAAAPTNPYQPTDPRYRLVWGYDDQTNFSSSLLGVAQE